MNEPFVVDDAVARTVDLDGLRVAYLTGGSATDRPPVVLLHGGGLDRAAISWKHAIPALAADRRVYAPDWPGFGASDPPDTPPEAITTEYFIDVLDRYREALGLEEVALCGLSMGGGVALGYALSHPDRVSRLALIDSYGLGAEVPGGKLGSLAVQLSLPSDLGSALLRRSRRLTALSVAGVMATGHLTEAFVDEVYAEVQREVTGATWRAFQRNEIREGQARTNYLDRLPDLPMAVSFVHGENDPIVPVEWARRGASRAPNATVEVLADCGHWAPRELPETTNRHLREFL